jgi:hypothetical protein
MGKVDRKQERSARLRLYEAPDKSNNFIAADALPFFDATIDVDGPMGRLRVA